MDLRNAASVRIMSRVANALSTLETLPSDPMAVRDAYAVVIEAQGDGNVATPQNHVLWIDLIQRNVGVTVCARRDLASLRSLAERRGWLCAEELTPVAPPNCFSPEEHILVLTEASPLAWLEAADFGRHARLTVPGAKCALLWWEA